MKKIIVRKIMSVTATILLLTSLLLCCVSCTDELAQLFTPSVGQLDGTYAQIWEWLDDDLSGHFYTFQGSTVTFRISVSGHVFQSYTATYRIKEDKITFIADTISVYLAHTYDANTGKYISTYNFEKSGNTIKIGNKVCTKYTGELPE